MAQIALYSPVIHAFGHAEVQDPHHALYVSRSIGSRAPVWDGLDLSREFRLQFLNGVIPLVYTAISLFSMAWLGSRYLFRLKKGRMTGYISLSEATSSANPASAILEAENQVLLGVAVKESPDFTSRDIRKLGGDDLISSVDHNEGRSSTQSAHGSSRWLLALWRAKKDLFELCSAAALSALLIAKMVRDWNSDDVHSRWEIGALLLWTWATFLILIKLVLLHAGHMRVLEYASTLRLPSLYFTIEIHTTPWFLIYTVISFLDFRSALLNKGSAEILPTAIFVVTTLLCLVEVFARRPSRYTSPQKPIKSDLPIQPEMCASLFDQATFSYLNRFVVRSAFPGLCRVAPLSMKTVPDLRPDDKTARVLLSYRRDIAENAPAFIKRRGLVWRLAWHLRGLILQQQMWSYMRSAVVCLPPLLFQAILRHVKERDQPTHVAILYAVTLMALQIVGALTASTPLWIGRRMCVRLRSIIIGEVFTKALRRKDAAGKATEDDDEKSQGESDANATIKSRTAEEEEKELEEELERASSGKILNLISVDTFRVSEVCAYLHFLWPEMPLTLIITMCMLYKVLGLSAIAGVTTLILITPMQAAASRLFYVYQKKLLAAADARLNLATEVISSVRIVKYFAWETKFLSMMQETRQRELHALWRRALTMVAGGVLMFGCPVIVSATTFVFHTEVLHRELNAETAFVSLSLFTILRGPLEMLTDMTVSILQAYVSLKRIDEFLAEQETAKYTIVRAPSTSSDPQVGFVDASFTWADETLARADPTVFRIRDFNLSFPTGKLSIVLGPVGSGKSTLLLSLLGETNCLAGSSFLPSPVARGSGSDPAILTDTTAYAAQSPWLESLTIRENILFGAAFNEQRYLDVLDVCALNPDLAQFVLGDDTEVGEKGTVLSGGQKARISLARAIYSSSKFILLDDVLSAVDSHTAQHLVEKCLTGRLMRHRTCILVTHAVDLCLPKSSYVVSMDNGVIAAAGSPDEVELDTTFETVLKKVEHEHDGADPNASAFTIEATAEGVTDQDIQAQKAREKAERQEKLKLIKNETQSEGSVSKEVYFMYIRALGGWSICGIILLVFVIAQLAEVGVSIALRYWAQSYDNRQESVSALAVHAVQHSIDRWRFNAQHASSRASSAFNMSSNLRSMDAAETRSPNYWLRVYCGIAAINLAFYGGRVAFMLWRGLVASKTIYTELIEKILGAPIRFFDSTPTGRILNRLSKDMETIDQDMATSVMFLTLEFFAVLAIIGSISAVLPQFLAVAAVLSVLYCLMGYLYIAASRELKRSDSVTRSPIFSLFGEALNGVSTIRAYGDSGRFIRNVFRLIDTNNRPFLSLWQVNRWLSVRVDVLGALVTLTACLFVVLSKGIDAALAGFVVSFAIGIADRTLWLVRMWATLEVNANSVERVQEYLDLEQEAQGGVTPPAIWPSRDGSISVEALTASYSPELPPVLKNVSFKVAAGEKVGICGRTGSGKSTLGLSFFRFIEPSSGRIVIDGLDINTLRLSELRSRLTIVAQESALFAGTLRFNLDPFDQYEDSDIWDALRRVQMAAPSSVRPTPRPTPHPSRPGSPHGGSSASEDDTILDENDRYVVKTLSMQVTESGKNFSAGQRQLLALARGILKLQAGHSSILLLDESTASLDKETDERIQETIRSELGSITMLVIAHRLGTIVDLDKILVLSAGEVLEFDTPWNLLQNESSVFSDLCRKSGEYESLVKVANERHEQSRSQ